jgi:BlaI family transcriptional regulator, penicillinase repressor
MTMPKRKPAAISEAESEVMQVIWDRGPSTSEDVVAALESHGKWQDATVKTLLNRLLRKRALGAQKDGRRYVYSALLTREEWMSAESHGFLDRMFGGRVAPLVSYFSQQKKLGKKDIEELKRLIRELDDGG